MKIIKFSTMQESKLPVLVKENEYEYAGCSSSCLNSPDAIFKMMNEIFCLSKMTEEYMYMLCFDSAMHPVGIFEVSHGDVNYTVISPRTVFMKALLAGAETIALVHNHPSGSSMPSKQDIVATEKIKKAGEIMNIKLVDHIVIGDGEYKSFVQLGLLEVVK